MAVTVTNLIMGPATLYVADFGAPEPLDSQVTGTPAASAWTDMGGTNDGVTLIINQTYTQLGVDQLLDDPESRKTARDVRIRTNLAEATLENLQASLNGGTITTAALSHKVYDPEDSLSSDEPGYAAILLDGQAPSYKRRRVIVRKVLSIENVEAAFKKDNQFLWPVTFKMHYVSSLIKPFRIIDGIPTS